MSMTNAERQRRHRARRKAEREALRNNQQQTQLRNDTIDNPLRNEVRDLKIKLHMARAQANKYEALLKEYDKLKETSKALRNDIATLKAFKAEVVEEWLPEAITKAQRQLKSDRTKLRNERRLMEHMRDNLKLLTPEDRKLILNVLHPDRAPADRRDRFNKAFQAFRGATE